MARCELMSSIDGKPMDKLVDMILNVMSQDSLGVWSAVRKKMDTDGPATIKAAFEKGISRLLAGPFKDHIEVRWGMSLCVHCNDGNVEKNGIAYIQPNGDGLEFNQCLNCRIGILYNVVSAKATMDSYLVSIGKPDQFVGAIFFWDAIVPDKLRKFLPMYELVKGGQWIGTVSFDKSIKPKFRPFSSMTGSTPRDAETPWSYQLPPDVKNAAEQFVKAARHQIEVGLAIK
jgi:hypothetical protein